jgi:hypothetical protein
LISITASSIGLSETLDPYYQEQDRNAPIDFGYGPGAGVPKLTAALRSFRAFVSGTANAVPNGGADAGVKGFFGPPVTWPLIPIHMVLLSDGRVLTYGTDLAGAQGAQFNYDIWDPSLGTSDDSQRCPMQPTQTYFAAHSP